MSRNEQFRIEEFVIHVDEGTYLVEVYKNDEMNIPCSRSKICQTGFSHPDMRSG